MKLKKPDQVDSLVKSRMEKDGGLWSDNVADLLRQQHRAVVEIVQKDIRIVRRVIAQTDVVSTTHVQALGEWRALRELLNKLKKMSA